MEKGDFELAEQKKKLRTELNYEKAYCLLFNGVTDAIRMLDRRLASADTLRAFLCDLQRQAEDAAVDQTPRFYTPSMLK